ncbi:DUF456 domain-containing protein [Natronosalvus vescus]|uniref:DUF456 domain-containing protein n=1 Tax=Natronosalvus vescus TaxID=2953881 RepID=UPI0020901E30|nr:DUF456 domain-containing protein [Natronosalvus vescus]
MVEVLVALSIALFLAGIVGTVVPLVPGGILSLSGLFLYWWQSGYAEPGLLALAVLTSLGLLTLFVEFFAGSIAARAGGASWGTTVAGAVAGIVLMLVTGPLGLLVGLFGTIFVLEFAANGDLDGSLRTAGYATAGILASTAVQVMLTTTIFLGFLVAVFVL